jgi:hypothetical protein
MQKPFSPLLAVAALAAAQPLGAQHRPARDETLDGVRYSVLGRFSRVPALSDSVTAVYRDSATEAWLFVSTLRSAEERPTRIAALLRRLGKAALGKRDEPLEWGIRPGSANPSDLFYETLYSVGSPGMRVSVRQVRSRGRDVLAGHAFVARGAPADPCAPFVSIPASRAEERVIASLLGIPAIPDLPINEVELPRVDVSGFGARRDDPEAERVRAAFAAYVGAIKDHRGAAAADLVIPSTLAFYQDVKNLALHGTPQDVHALPLTQRAAVLSARHRLDAARLAAMSPRELMVWGAMQITAVNDAMTADTPDVAGGRAWAALRVNGVPSGLRIQFFREGDAWRLDLVSLLGSAGCRVETELRARGMTSAQLDASLLHQLEVETGRAPSPDIWLPLVRTGSGPN